MLVNNAGYGLLGWFEDMTDDQIRSQYETNVFGVMNVTRAVLPVMLVAVVIGVAAFCFKEELFAVILAPKDADFVTYRLLYAFSSLVTEADAPDFLVKLINKGLAEQFIIHMKAALCSGILCASP